MQIPRARRNQSASAKRRCGRMDADPNGIKLSVVWVKAESQPAQDLVAPNASNHDFGFGDLE
jgi:hypothetical protein